MKKVWIYIGLIIGFLVIYHCGVIAKSPKGESLYPLAIWYLSGIIIYPIVALIAGGVLHFIVKDKKYIFILILLSGFLFFIVSMVVNYRLLFFRDNHGLGLNTKFSLIFAVEVIFIQFIVLGILKVYGNYQKKRIHENIQ